MKEIKFNPHTNMLEEDRYTYSLQDVAKPELYRDIFPYTEVPRITFNHRHVPMNMPEHLYITDTTFRDGQQSRTPYTAKQIVDIYKLLHKLSGKKGIIRQSEFFVYSKKDREALEKCMELGYKFPEITTWIRASKKDFELVKNLGIKETGVLMSCSDYHIFNKMGLTRSKAMEKYLGIAKDCMASGLVPRCHLEDVTRADIYGFVIPFVIELNKLAEESGIPVKIRVCDTLGLGLAFPGISLPRSIPGIIYSLNHYAGIPSERIEWHGHNDFYKSVANASTAWLYGASNVNCSLLGIGERTGNVPLEAMVFEYAAFKGTFDGMNPRVITEIADYISKETNYTIPPMTPFIGENFNTTKAGIHADGLIKDEEIYNIFDTKTMLNKPPLVTVSNTSGAAGIAYWLNNYYNLPESRRFSKSSELVHFIKQWVDEEFENGRVTFISADEMKKLIAEFKKTHECDL